MAPDSAVDAAPPTSTSKASKGKGKKEKAKSKSKKDKKDKKSIASKQDRYDLYQRSVQEPDADIEFFDQVFDTHFGRKASTLREDFCGAMSLACAWVKTRPNNTVWEIDLDPEPIAWGQEHNISKLTDEQKSRLTVIEGDVRAPQDYKVDLIAAQNFSFCCFKRRNELLKYLQAAYAGLKDEGILVLDIFGGPDSQEPSKDKTKHKGFTYIWDQKFYDAITNEIQCAIHYTFKDGSRLKDAFTYDWRLWTIAELRELLTEAGFSKTEAYWEESDDDGDGTGEFNLTASAENEDAWIAYVVGVR